MLANQTGKKSCKRLASSMYTNLSGFSSTMVLLLTSLTRPPGRRPRSVNDPASSGCPSSATTCTHRPQCEFHGCRF